MKTATYTDDRTLPGGAGGDAAVGGAGGDERAGGLSQVVRAEAMCPGSGDCGVVGSAASTDQPAHVEHMAEKNRCGDL